MKEFLVQYYSDLDEEKTLHTALWTETEVIKYDNESDIYGIYGMIVYDISEYGNIKPLSSAGWQPMCEITWHDKDGNVVIHGYGEDH